jgi:hypothetical protein
VPEGLSERLITAIQTAQDRSVVELPTSDATPRIFAARRIRLSRRQMLWAGGGVALVILVAVGVSQLGWSQRTVAQHELAGDVGKLLGKLDPKTWRSLAGGALPKGIVLDSAIVAKPVQVQDVAYQSDAGWSSTVTAINIAPAGRPKAILFVVRSSARFAVPSVPTTTTRLFGDGMAAKSGGAAVCAGRRGGPWPAARRISEQGARGIAAGLRTVSTAKA